MTMDTDSEPHSVSKSAYPSVSQGLVDEDAATNAMKRAMKSGEIFHTECGKFFFVCTFCDIKFGTCHGVLKHIKSHFDEKEQRNAMSLAEPEFVCIDEPRLNSETIKTEITLNDEDQPVVPMNMASSLESTKKDDVAHCITKKSKLPQRTKVVKIVKLKRIKPNPRLIALKKKTLIDARQSYSKMPSNIPNTQTSFEIPPKRQCYIESRTQSIKFNDASAHLQSLTPSTDKVPPAPEKFLCDVCGSIQKSKGKLTEHMQLHENRKIECEDCGKRFRRFSTLRQHYWLHDQPSFACKVCSKVFKMQRYVDRHMAVHEEPKFQCRQCDAKFHFETVRKIHERTRHFIV